MFAQLAGCVVVRKIDYGKITQITHRGVGLLGDLLSNYLIKIVLQMTAY